MIDDGLDGVISDRGLAGSRFSALETDVCSEYTFKKRTSPGSAAPKRWSCWSPCEDLPVASATALRLIQHHHIIFFKMAVGGDYGPVVQLGGGDDETVGRIFVNIRKMSGGDTKFQVEG